VENPFWGFSKQRWARSGRPWPRQLPQALHGWTARLRARSRSIARVSRRQGWSALCREGRCGAVDSGAAPRPAWASPVPRSPSPASGVPDSESQSRRSRARAPAPSYEPSPGGSAARLESTACRSGSPARQVKTCAVPRERAPKPLRLRRAPAFSEKAKHGSACHEHHRRWFGNRLRLHAEQDAGRKVCLYVVWRAS
jgi:hypothetical protein